ncbi:hypothetical protein [Streptomyces sp. NPDC018055]|uniref:hypothetical protein n=1 Tax=Streptomyces sp. NPDC018055 TaxID=3365038 RepID=UPI0037B9129B
MGDSASRRLRKQEEAERKRREAELQQKLEAVEPEPPLVDFTAMPNGLPLPEGAPVEGRGKTVKPSATEDAHIRRYLADNSRLSFKDVSIAVFRLLVQEAADAARVMESSGPGAPEPRRPLFEAVSEEVEQIKSERAILKSATSSGS